MLCLYCALKSSPNAAVFKILPYNSSIWTVKLSYFYESTTPCKTFGPADCQYLIMGARHTELSHTQIAIKDGACLSLDASNIDRCDAVSMVTVVSSVTPATVAMAPLLPPNPPPPRWLGRCVEDSQSGLFSVCNETVLSSRFACVKPEAQTCNARAINLFSDFEINQKKKKKRT